MHLPEVYLIDVNVIYQILSKNIWYISKVLIFTTILFYWLPTKIFPQDFTGRGVRKVVMNFIYMTAYVETVVTFLIFIKTFNLIIFFFSIILTKLIFLKWYHKENIRLLLYHKKVEIMLFVFDFLDKPKAYYGKIINKIKNFITVTQQKITTYNVLKTIIFFAVFFYILSIFMARGLYSYSNIAPDTSQFIEWVDYLQKNILYADNKTFGADFYGMAVMVFFIDIFTNIDPIVIFSVYPIVLLLALYLSIYFVIREAGYSKFTALSAVMLHGMVLMTPLANYILGKIIVTTSPDIFNFHGLSFYVPTAYDISNGYTIGSIPFFRYISGMAYEHSSVFVFLNIFFLINSIANKKNIYIVLYALTLMLVFIFHGGGAIVLMPISILIAINAIIFLKLDLSLLKKGLLSVIFGAIFGNFWLLSMIKYGLPERVGAAAPFLDKLLNNVQNRQEVIKLGFNSVKIIYMTEFHFILIALLLFALIFSYLFTKNRFLNSSFLMIPTGVFLLYFGSNLGFPTLTSHSRLGIYMFFAIVILFAFYMKYFIFTPLYFIFRKHIRWVKLFITYFLFFTFVIFIPKWTSKNLFWENINAIEYTSIPKIILQIDKQNVPFTWTVVSYVQEYSKVKNKGYHVNTQNFLLKYNPKDKYLKIPTKKVYIFVENYPNPYKGLGQWYYRWRSQIQNSLKSWVAIYEMYHNNIKMYYKTKTVTVYEIDNSNYMDYLSKKSKR